MQDRFIRVREFFRSLGENFLPPASDGTSSSATELLLEPKREPEPPDSDRDGLDDNSEDSPSSPSEASWGIFSAQFPDGQLRSKWHLALTAGFLLIVSALTLLNVASSAPAETQAATEGSNDPSSTDPLSAGVIATGATNLGENADGTSIASVAQITHSPRNPPEGRTGEGAATADADDGSTRNGGEENQGSQPPEDNGGGEDNGDGITTDGQPQDGEPTKGDTCEAIACRIVGHPQPQDDEATTPTTPTAAAVAATTAAAPESPGTSDPFGLANDLLKQAGDPDPMPPFTGESLGRPAQVIRLGLPGSKKHPRLYLTFDDGPHHYWTARVLDLLDRHDARATFFVVGTQAVAYPEVVREIVERGHTLGNHLWSHTEVPLKQEDLFRKEIRQTAALLGDDITNCLRIPYGYLSEEILDWSGEEGYELVHWSHDIQDWRRHDIETIREGFAEIEKNGTILLLHEHSGNNTLQALDEALTSLKARGWQFDTPICPLPF